jgi:hypothetical protein
MINQIDYFYDLIVIIYDFGTARIYSFPGYRPPFCGGFRKMLRHPAHPEYANPKAGGRAGR